MAEPLAAAKLRCTEVKIPLSPPAPIRSGACCNGGGQLSPHSASTSPTSYQMTVSIARSSCPAVVTSNSSQASVQRSSSTVKSEPNVTSSSSSGKIVHSIDTLMSQSHGGVVQAGRVTQPTLTSQQQSHAGGSFTSGAAAVGHTQSVAGSSPMNLVTSDHDRFFSVRTAQDLARVRKLAAMHQQQQAPIPKESPPLRHPLYGHGVSPVFSQHAPAKLNCSTKAATREQAVHRVSCSRIDE